MKKNLEKKIDQVFLKEGFENQFERAKEIGLEIILSVQKFTIEPTKHGLGNIHDKVADYLFVCKQIIRNASKLELKHFVKLNKSLEKTMIELDLKEVYTNILKRYEEDIHLIFEYKIKEIS